MKGTTMTARQRAALDWIARFISDNTPIQISEGI